MRQDHEKELSRLKAEHEASMDAHHETHVHEDEMVHLRAQLIQAQESEEAAATQEEEREGAAAAQEEERGGAAAAQEEESETVKTEGAAATNPEAGGEGGVVDDPICVAAWSIVRAD